MDDPGLLTVEFERSGSRLTVVLTGELDLATSSELADQIIDHADRTQPTIWLDMSGVTFCGSAGIRIFVALHNHATSLGGRMAIYRPNPSVMRILRATQVDELIPILGAEAPAAHRPALAD